MALSTKTVQRLRMLAARTQEWNEKAQAIPKELREEFAMMVASTFSDFAEFAEVAVS